MEISLNDVLAWTHGELVNEDRLKNLDEIRVSDVSGLKGSTSRNICFFFSPQYKSELPQAAPGILITARPFVQPLLESGLPLLNTTAVIVVEDPYYTMAVASEKLSAHKLSMVHLPVEEAELEATTIHPTAVVSEQAEIASKGVKIGAHVVIEERVQVGEGSVIYPNTYVGPGVKIGKFCTLYPNVSLYENTILGNRCLIHSGTVIGSDGFGYAPEMKHHKPVRHQKIYHTGKVILGDDVEVGSNTCIDRGTMGDTVVGSGSKIDNQVQVAHNCQLGEGTILCGHVGLTGGISTGKFVYFGGASGAGNKVHVGDYAQIAAMAHVSKPVPPGGTAKGNPQRDAREYLRFQAQLNRMVEEYVRNTKKRKGE